MKHGTAWVDPGQGATVGMLLLRLSLARINAAAQTAAVIRLSDRTGAIDWRDTRPTNLRLTGHPLTEYDIRRIGEARTTQEEGPQP